MKSKLLLPAIACLAMLLHSCSNKGVSGLPVPKNASVVFHIDGASLSSKLSWDEIKQSSYFKEMYERTTDTFTRLLLNDPKNTGINTGSDMVMFFSKQGTRNYVTVEGKLLSAKGFESTVRSRMNGVKVNTSGDMSYAMEENSLVTWDNSKFIAVTSTPMSFSYSEDAGGSAKNTEDSLMKFAKDLYGLSKSNSLESDDHFTALLKEKGDFHTYSMVDDAMFPFGNSPFKGGGEEAKMMRMLNLMSTFLKGTVSATTTSFDDGKITSKGTYYYNETMTKVMDKQKFESVSKDLVNKIPSQNTVAAIVSSYPPEMIRDFLKAFGFDGAANSFLAKYNFTLDELIAATSGKYVVSVSDLNPPTAYDPEDSERDEESFGPFDPKHVKIFMAAGLRNKATVDKLINAGLSRLDTMQRTMFNKTVSYQTTNDWLVLSNTPETLQAFLNGPGYAQPFASAISGHPFGMYIDLQKAMKTYISMGPASMSNTANASLGMWQDVVLTGGDYKDGKVSFDLTINLVDGKTNSLKQINQYIQKLYGGMKQDQQASMRRFEDMQDVDSAYMVAPRVEREVTTEKVEDNKK